MKYTSINIQGNLISEEILHKIEESDVQGQLAKDFGFETGINLRSEIEYAWSKIKLDWKYFFERTEKLPASDPYGTTLSRRWMTSFFSTLGFDLTLQKTSLQGENQQLYSISHTCDQLEGFPIHIVGFYDPSHPEKNTLDIRSSGGTSRLSPHATIQEYLNVTEYLYAMATNGLVLRLLRDSGRLVKMTYIEFDLKRLLEEDKYSEFTLLYRLLHASRFPKSKQETDQCFMEKYYQDSIESGNRIRDGLSDAVKESLIALGNGLLEHLENEELRKKIASGRPDAREFYHQLLRLIYRLLFLMVTEERDLIFTDLQDESKGPDIDDLLKGIKHPTKKQKEIYYCFYSLARLRKLSQKRYLLENQYCDLWQGLIQTFSLFETGGTGQRLGIQALGSELFNSNAMPDLAAGKVSNKVLLQCIKSLNEFEDEKHNLSFINYRALDVEELGSVYEGLLELEPVFEWVNGKPKFIFKKGSERSSSGSHYTPEDLVKPLIKHSLEYLIEERVSEFYKGKATDKETIKKLLDLKICDVACGSGHILLSAARRIALEVARVETGEQQPNPTSFRYALKEVIKTCIYGVDKNPLAVELCKVALWLESHNPGEPLSFLDHRIKCGDAIVGLAHREELQKGISDEAFKKLPDDDKDIASTFLKKNRQERVSREKSDQAVQLTTETDHNLMEQVKELNRLIENFSNLPENTPEEIEKKEKAYRILANSESLRRLKIMADLQILPFFLPKTVANKDLFLTDSQYFRYLRGETRIPDAMEMKAIETAVNYSFFHWFLEFPDVLQNGGFNCILGNPPYLGNKKLSGFFGQSFLSFTKEYYTGGSVDLITFFVRRIFNLIKLKGFFSIISTNTISQGGTREGGLEYIIRSGGKINFALKSVKWPGRAAVIVSLFTVVKDNKWSTIFLAQKKVDNINSLLDIGQSNQNPYQLLCNKGKCFIGSTIEGKGFILEESEVQRLKLYEPIIIKPYLTGSDLLNNLGSSPSRYIIDFGDLSEHQASRYPDSFEIVKTRVKPHRDKVNRERNKLRWWIYAETRPGLYNSIRDKDYVIARARISKTQAWEFVNTGQVLADALVVTNLSKFRDFAILQSTIHAEWAWKYCTTMKSDMNYGSFTIFETFPFPKINNSTNEQDLETVGRNYNHYRNKLVFSLKLGLTKIYNAVNSRVLVDAVTERSLNEMDNRLIEKQLGKEVWNLWNHLHKTENTCSFEEAVKEIIKLRELHVEMDIAVLEAYGWQDIDLRHDFYEVDYLPENDRVRFTIHPDARKEVLKRLLKLNHKIHEEEVAAGLWDKKTHKEYKHKKTKANQVSEDGEEYRTLFY